MKFKTITCLFVMMFISCSKNNFTTIDVISHKLNIEFDITTNQLIVDAELKIVKPDSVEVIDLLFTREANINHVLLNNKDTLKYSHKNDTLFISPDLTEFKINIAYKLPISKFGSDSCIVLTRPKRWCPFRYNDISTFSDSALLPHDYYLYSTSVEEKPIKLKRLFKFKSMINTGYPLIITKDDYYHKYTRLKNQINFNFLFHENDSTVIDEIIEESLRTIDFCEEFIGDYKRNNLTLIEMPNAQYCQSLESFVVVGDVFLNLYKKYNMKFWVAHELIHQWIGSGYYHNMSPQNNLRCFIEESLTEYIRFQFIEQQFGNDQLKQELKSALMEYYRNIKGTEKDCKISENRATRVVYTVGPLIFHWVKTQIGEENWQSFIRDLYSKNYGEFVDYKIFRKTLELYASQSVIETMEKWVNQVGVPEEILAMIKTYNKVLNDK